MSNDPKHAPNQAQSLESSEEKSEEIKGDHSELIPITPEDREVQIKKVREEFASMLGDKETADCAFTFLRSPGSKEVDPHVVYAHKATLAHRLVCFVFSLGFAEF
jgi:hypothetical protein